MGSLLAALASYLQARQRHGQWLLRIEDLDRARNQAGAVDAILRSLDAHGLYWDEQPVYQSQRHAAYQQALQFLRERDQVFYCTCSRKQLGGGSGLYPGTCRARKQPTKRQYSIRVRVPDQVIGFEDAAMGHYEQSLARDIGDFVLLRADGVVAYQLAVVVDDDWQAISEVVRGADLLDNTPRQIFLQQLFGFATPQYCHVPLLVNANREKLSKQTAAPALDDRQALANLRQCLRYLGQYEREQDAQDIASVEELHAWALSIWNPDKMPRHGIFCV